MAENQTQAEPAGRPTMALRVAQVAAIVALGLSLYLTYIGFAAAGPAGCGDGAGLVDCESVLASRWGKWLGVPVGLLAALTYAAALVGSVMAGGAEERKRRVGWTVMLATALLAAGAAMWFVMLQVSVLDALCAWCLAAHGAGVVYALAVFAAARKAPASAPLAGAVGLVGVGLLIAGQWLFVPTGIEVERAAPATAGAASADDSTDAPGDARASLLEGRIRLDPATLPAVGPVDSPHVMVKIFDYTCPHCREVHEMLPAAIQGIEPAPVILPVVVPLNKQCNPHIRSNNEKHKEACDYARLSLALWRADGEAWPDFHEYLMTGPTPPPLAEATERAEQTVGADALAAAMADAWVSQQIARNVGLYGILGGGRVPKLVFGDTRTSGSPASPAALRRLIDQEWD